MKSVSDNNNRIARNAILLYFRMFLTVVISLFTSRVVFQSLGVDDYGIYNVVGGVVSMMGLVNTAMVVASQRFITYELGKGVTDELKKTFSACFFSFVLLAIIIVVVAETVGLWLFYNKLTIPSDRIDAAFFVFQFSVFSCVNSLLSNPYNACIIAHERMDVYAYVSIVEVVLKLFVAYLLTVFSYDRLIIYGLLILVSQFVVTLIYRFYCIFHFEECHLVFHKDFNLYKKLISFTGWNLLGSIANLLQNQGLNVLLNLFFCPAVNASRAIAVHVNVSVGKFFSNFFTAVKPQIIKYYAVNDKKNLYQLINRSSRFSYYLILLISLPLFLQVEYIIEIWLGTVPEHASTFTKLMITITAVDAISNPLMTLAQATGKISLYSTVTGSILLTIVPISYIVLKSGYCPESVYYVALAISIFLYFVRIFLLKRMVDFDIFYYVENSLYPIVKVTLFALIVPLICQYLFSNKAFSHFVVVSFVSVVSVILSSLILGMNRNEREYIYSFIKSRIHIKRR